MATVHGTTHLIRLHIAPLRLESGQLGGGAYYTTCRGRCVPGRRRQKRGLQPAGPPGSGTHRSCPDRRAGAQRAVVSPRAPVSVRPARSSTAARCVCPARRGLQGRPWSLRAWCMGRSEDPRAGQDRSRAEAGRRAGNSAR